MGESPNFTRPVWRGRFAWCPRDLVILRYIKNKKQKLSKSST